MKKYCIFVVIALLAIMSSASAQTCDCEGLQAQIDALTARIEALEGNAPAVQDEPAAEISGDFEPVVIGDFTVELIGWELGTTQYTNIDYIQLNYRFTNNSSESASFGWKISRKAFQDGIELKTHLFLDGETTTDIRPGKSIEVKDGFQIRDNQTEIELEFTPLIAFKPDVITRIINIK